MAVIGWARSSFDHGLDLAAAIFAERDVERALDATLLVVFGDAGTNQQEFEHKTNLQYQRLVGSLKLLLFFATAAARSSCTAVV